jgi:hypothetical protein
MQRDESDPGSTVNHCGRCNSYQRAEVIPRSGPSLRNHDAVYAAGFIPSVA